MPTLARPTPPYALLRSWSDIDLTGVVPIHPDDSTVTPNTVYLRGPSPPLESDVARMTADIAVAFAGLSPPFTPQAIAVITWFAVGRKAGQVDHLNTFQAALGVDSAGRSFVVRQRWGGTGLSNETCRPATYTPRRRSATTTFFGTKGLTRKELVRRRRGRILSLVPRPTPTPNPSWQRTARWQASTLPAVHSTPSPDRTLQQTRT